VIPNEMTLQHLQQICRLKETEDILQKESIDLPAAITETDDICTKQLRFILLSPTKER
jgi:hypothetical protein